MKKLFLIALSVFVCAGVSFADPCKDKTNEAKNMLAKCKAMKKGSSEYKQCASSYNLLKTKAQQACRSGGMDENEMQAAIKQWRTQVDRCKGKQSSRCASAHTQLGNYQ